MERGAWWAAVHEVAKSQTRLSDFTFTFHFHALEKEMATHSTVLAWRIPGMGEPGGLLSMGSHRVGHDWIDLAAAAAAAAAAAGLIAQLSPELKFLPLLLWCCPQTAGLGFPGPQRPIGPCMSCDPGYITRSAHLPSLTGAPRGGRT